MEKDRHRPDNQGNDQLFEAECMPGSKMGFCFGIAEAECRDLGSLGVESQIRVLDDWGANVPEHLLECFFLLTSW